MTAYLLLRFMKGLLEKFVAQRLALVDRHLGERIKKRQFGLISQEKGRVLRLLGLTVIRVALNGQHW